MAQYKTHSLFNLFLALPISALLLLYFFSPSRPLLLTFIIAFAYSTLFMSPDMDLAHQIKPLSLRGILTLPFRLYSRIFRHRGLSHHPLLGTLTRLLFLGLLALLLYAAIYRAFPSHKTLLKALSTHKPFIIYGFGGVFLADLSHLALDL